jgi:hypothetical protein
MNDTIKIQIHRLVLQQLDWNFFLESALWHGVAPMVFNNLKNLPERHHIPDEVIENLKPDYRKNFVRNTILFAEFDRILAAFEKHQIQVIPIKGAAFARNVYGDIALRPMSDIDILVKRTNVHRAKKIVYELGYRPYKGNNLDQLLKTYYHIKFIDSANKIPLEIHWAVTGPNHPYLIRTVDSKLVDTWWRRALRYNTECQNILSLNPADQIYLLASHFFKHRFNRSNGVFNSCGALIQLCDIYNLAIYYKNDIDWEKLKIESRQIGLYKIVSVCLSIVKEIFDLQNGHTMDFLNDWEIGGLDQEIINHVTKRLFLREDKLSPVPSVFIKAQAEMSFQKWFKNIFKAIFPNPEVLSQNLKRPLRSKAFYLNYLMRPLILLIRYRKTLFEIQRIKEERILERWIDTQS